MTVSKEDQASYGKKHYENNKEKMKACAIDFRAKRKTELAEYVNSLKNKPCTDCGLSFLPCVMDFDHIGDDKFKGVSRMVVGTYSKARIDEEIFKCELVCANCHRVRTFSRMRDKKATVEATT